MSDPSDSVLVMGMGVTSTGSGDTAGWFAHGVAVVFEDTEYALVPVAEVLTQVAALEPGPEAIALLHGLVGRAMRVLAGLTDKGWRRDDRGIADCARVGLVEVERIVVA